MGLCSDKVKEKIRIPRCSPTKNAAILVYTPVEPRSSILVESIGYKQWLSKFKKTMKFVQLKINKILQMQHLVEVSE